AYNAWANDAFLTWLKGLDIKLLQQEVQSSFTTIDYTLQHLLRTQKFWLAFVCGESIEGFDWRVKSYEIEVLFQEVQASSLEMQQRFAQFSEADLLETLSLNMPWSKNQLSRYEYIVHLINHGSFHRGQIVTMARMLGITEGIPATDYNIFRTVL
ncbi:MAG: DinB family protein, partial [Bacteroidia bacterium]